MTENGFQIMKCPEDRGQDILQVHWGTLIRDRVLYLIRLASNTLTFQQDVLPRIRTRHSGFGALHLSEPGYPPSPNHKMFMRMPLFVTGQVSYEFVGLQIQQMMEIMGYRR